MIVTANALNIDVLSAERLLSTQTCRPASTHCGHWSVLRFPRSIGLDRLYVPCAEMAVAVRANGIGKALAGRGSVHLVVPPKVASLEAEIYATGFRLDGAMAVFVVE